MKSIYLFIFTLMCSSILNAASPVVRINSTTQGFNASQPWEKNRPSPISGLGTHVEGHGILTTASMVANASFIEFESLSGDKRFPGEVIAIDYEANLALLKATSDEGQKFIDSIDAISVASAAKKGDIVQAVQVDETGQDVFTDGKIIAVDVLSSFTPGNSFLTYEIKASMQSAGSSFTIPILKDGKLSGILTSYNSKDQLVDCIATEILTAFLEDVKDGEYAGFPSLGIAVTRTTDPNFRKWLKLEEEQGGVYVTAVARNSTADKAEIKKGDVVLAVNDTEIDAQGYFQSELYGKLYWAHLTRATQKIGETIKIKIKRDGEVIELSAELQRRQEGIIPAHMNDRAPNYLVKGGLIFQELTASYLRAFGKDWQTRAPLSLIDVYTHPQDYEEGRNRLVFLSAVIPTPATLGYENIRHRIIEEVNGKPVADTQSLIEAFKHPKDGRHTIKLDSAPHIIYLDAKVADGIDKGLLRRGLPALSRAK